MNAWYRRAFVVCLAVFAASPFTLAGRAPLRADEERIFNGYCSVILARIIRSREHGDGVTFTHHATLEPHSTLSGTFDCGVHPTLEVDFWVGDVLTSSVAEVPRDGSIVLAVVLTDVDLDGDGVKRNFIPSDRCLFMPEEAALVRVRGADDMKVWETLKRIQEGRLKPKPATRPSTRPTR